MLEHTFDKGDATTMKFYSPEEADKVATQFFKYYYKDRGVKKWKGFIISEQSAELKKLKKKPNKNGETLYEQVKYGDWD